LERVPDAALAQGPGLVTAAFGIDTRWTGLDLCDPRSPLRLEARPSGETVVIETSPRIGIAYAGPPWADEPWRFTIARD
jgi:DNA-3-methyladenine glycosylase